MKKTLLAIAAVAGLAIGAQAQGNISIAGAVGGIWNTTNSAPTTTSLNGFDITLLFAPASTSSALSSLFASSPTNASGNASGFTTSAAWAAVTTDTAGSWAQVDGTTASGLLIQASSALKGTFAYNSGSAWSAANLNAGTTYSIYELSWWGGTGNTLTTLAAAEAAGTWIGWSKVFQYTPTSGAVAPTQISPGNNAGYFGVGGAVPEPTTLALAGLGGLGLMALRRKK